MPLTFASLNFQGDLVINSVFVLAAGAGSSFLLQLLLSRRKKENRADNKIILFCIEIGLIDKNNLSFCSLQGRNT